MLVWYVKREATIGQESFIAKADELFNYFESEKIRVVVPSLVVGELMCNVADETKREEIFDFISDNFEIIQHDVLSAREFARLRISSDRESAKAYANSNSIPKCRMINDHNICAVALSNKCDAIFSHNLKDFEKFNNGEIPIYTLDYVDTIKANNDRERQRLGNIQIQLELPETLKFDTDSESDDL